MSKALVIGASRGLGLGLTEEFLQRGWDVTATYRNANKGGLDALAKAQDALKLLEVDVADAGQAVTLAESLREERFDVVFINAGIYGAKHQRVDQATDDELLEIIRTNVAGPLRLARLLAGTVVAQRGVLAAMSSKMGSIDDSSGGAELYRMSKVSLNMLLHGLAQEPVLADQGVTVLSVHPGWVQTDMGGTGAPTTVTKSAKGMVDMLAARAGAGGHHFVDFRNDVLTW